MCIAVIAVGAHPRWPIVVAANRDEYHARATAPLSRWQDGSGIIAGKDLVGGGTWLGLHEEGRLVLVTNFRVPGYPKPGRPSRGGLVTGLLDGTDPLAVPIADYNPFNLVCMNGRAATLLSNYPEEQRRPLAAGIHGVSNGAFDPPWPKTTKLHQRFLDWLGSSHDSLEPLFSALADPSPTETTELGPEDRFSGIFIRDPVYGTRSSTVVAIDNDGQGRIVERSFDSAGQAVGELCLQFAWGLA